MGAFVTGIAGVITGSYWMQQRQKESELNHELPK
jgi:hypothetical protein